MRNTVIWIISSYNKTCQIIQIVCNYIRHFRNELLSIKNFDSITIASTL